MTFFITSTTTHTSKTTTTPPGDIFPKKSQVQVVQHFRGNPTQRCGCGAKDARGVTPSGSVSKRRIPRGFCLFENPPIFFGFPLGTSRKVYSTVDMNFSWLFMVNDGKCIGKFTSPWIRNGNLFLRTDHPSLVDQLLGQTTRWAPYQW